jgi:hypothetical protein
LSISLLIMFDTLLLRLSLHCNIPLHFSTLHPTTIHQTSPHYTYRHFTFSHLHFTTLSFSSTHLHFLSFRFTSHHYTRHSIVLISQLISKIMNPSTGLKNFSPFHFTFYFILFFYLSSQPYTSLHFAIHIYNSLPFTFYFLSPSLPLTVPSFS